MFYTLVLLLATLFEVIQPPTYATFYVSTLNTKHCHRIANRTVRTVSHSTQNKILYVDLVLLWVKDLEVDTVATKTNVFLYTQSRLPMLALRAKHCAEAAEN